MRRPRPPGHTTRSSLRAALLSGVFPGLGQFYNGNQTRGFAVWGAITLSFAVAKASQYGPYALALVWLYAVTTAYYHAGQAAV